MALSALRSKLGAVWTAGACRVLGTRCRQEGGARTQGEQVGSAPRVNAHGGGAWGDPLQPGPGRLAPGVELPATWLPHRVEQQLLADVCNLGASF